MPQADVTDGRHTALHRDGSVRARGHVDTGRQMGEWTTDDTTGAVYEVTTRR
jgi:hypothetical protein